MKNVKLQETMEQLENGIRKIFESDMYKQYLKTMSRFHNYSLNNTILIAMQKPDATLVASYTAWNTRFGRQVQKGENGIRILIPAPYKKQIDVEKTDPVTGEILTKPDGSFIKEKKEIQVQAYKIGYVYDVSQTQGKPLPTLGINELTGEVEQYEMFFQALQKSCPVPIAFEQISDGSKGYFHLTENRIALQENMSQVQTIKTLIHEMAHQRLHSLDKNDNTEMEKLSRNSKEVEAESVAFAVCQYYGIETSDYSFAYIAGWSKGKELPELKGSLEKIKSASSEMIDEIENHLTVLQKEEIWKDLKAEDIKNIKCIHSEYYPGSRESEHLITCEIAGDPVTLMYQTSYHDDGDGFTIHSEGKDIWDAMKASELVKLETKISSAVNLYHFQLQLEKAETKQDLREIEWSVIEPENIFLTADHRKQLYDEMSVREKEISKMKNQNKEMR